MPASARYFNWANWTKHSPLRVGSGDQLLSQPISAVDQKAAIKQMQNAAPFISANCGHSRIEPALAVFKLELELE